MSRLHLVEVSGGYGRMQILHDISLQLDSGEAMVLLGRNGAGKTTLLRTIAGLQPTSGGQITLDDQRLHRRSAWQVMRRGVSMVLEGGRVLAGHTVADNLALGVERCRDRDIGDRLMAACRNAFPVLDEHRQRLAGSLSGGERMQLAISLALAAAPRILLLDEPSVGLSPQMVSLTFELLDTVRQLPDGPGLLIAEQLMGGQLDMASHAIILDNGRVAARGTPGLLRREGGLLTTYLGMPTPQRPP